MSSEVGSGQVAIFPVFKGFRKAVNTEVDGSTTEASNRFQRGFRSTGQSAGQAVGRGFRDTFASQTRDVAGAAVKQINAQVAVATRGLSAARLKEQDAAGKLRLAETQLIETQAKYAAGSSQVVRAEERAASAHRALETVQQTVKASTESLSSAQTRLAEATTRAEATTSSAGRGLRSAFSTVGSTIAGAGNTAASGFSGAMSRIRSSASSAADSVRNSVRLIGGIVASAVVYQGLAAATTAAKSAIIDFNSTLQNSTIAFTSLLGSGKRAQTFLGQLQQFAKTTPFEFTDLVKNSQLLLGMGIQAKNVVPFLTGLGDSVASVGGSTDVLNNTILAFSQISAKGTLSMDNLNQLLEGGVPSALKVLAAQFHVTTGQMVKMISTGKVQSSEALPLLIKGLEQGTSATAALGGMMDKQSATFTGAVSNIKDGVSQLLAGAFRPFFDESTKGLVAFAGYLSTPAAQKWADAVASAVQRAIDKVKSVKSVAADLIDGFLHGTDALGSNQSKFASWGAAAYGALASVGRVAGSVFQIISPLGPLVGRVLADIGPQLAKVAPALGTALLSLLPSVEQLIAALLPLLPQVAALIVSLAPAVQAIVAVLVPLIQYGLVPLLQALVDLTTPLAEFNSGVSLSALATEGLAGKFGPVFQGLVQLGQGIGVAIQGVIAFATGIATTVSAIVGQISAFVAGIIGVFAQVVAGIQQANATIAAVVTSIVTFLAGVVAAVTAVVAGLAVQIAVGFAQVAAVVTAAITTVQTIISNVLLAILGIWLLAWDQIAAVLAPIWAQITGIVGAAIGTVRGVVAAGVAAVQGVWNAVWGAIAGFIGPIWARITGVVSGAIGTVHGVVAAGVAAVQGVWNAVWGAISGFVSGIWGRITGTVSGGVSRAHGAVTGGLAAISGVWNSAWSAVAGFLGGIWSRISGAVSSGIGRVVSLAAGVGGRVIGAIGDAGALLYNVGSQIVQGLINGITGMIGSVGSAVGNLVGNAIDRAKAQLGIHSPSRVFQQIGVYVATGFIAGVAGSVSAVRSAMTKLQNEVISAFNAKGITRSTETSLLKVLQADNTKLVALANQRAALASKITAAKKTLSDALKTRNDFAASVADSVNGLGNITSASATAGSMIATLRNAVTGAARFTKDLASLQKLGLNSASAKQLTDQFAQTGDTSFADALLSGGKGAVSQVNTLQGQLAKQAKSLGTVAANALYQAGVDSAQGLVDGLNASLAKVTTASTKIADAIVSTVKKRLGIHSPSVVARQELGQPVGAGFALGITDQLSAAQTAMKKLTALPKLSTGTEGVLSAPGFKQTVLNYHAAPNQSFDEEKDLLDFMRRKTVVLGNA